MKLFEVQKLVDSPFKALVLGLSIETPLSYISDIENELVINNIITGEIIFDLLLSSGNSEERFVTGVLQNGKFNGTTFKFVTVLKEDALRVFSNHYYKDNNYLLNYSMLNSIQKKMIISGFNI